MLRRLEMDAMKPTLAISTMITDTFAGLVDHLASMSVDARFHLEPCPGCANRDERLRANAQYLLDVLATSPGHRETFEASPGLCFEHFQLVREHAQARADRELILGVQRKAARTLLHDLQDDVQKHDPKFRDELKGAERDSWQRAIFMTAGWRPPAESAAEPEWRR